MSLTISTARKVSNKILGLVDNPIATFVEYAGAVGSTVSSSVASAADGAPLNAANGGTYDFWVPVQAAATVVRYTVSRVAAFEVNFIGMAAHNIGTTGGLTVSAEHSDDGVTWTDLGVTVSPVDDQNIGLYFENTTAKQFRISISGLSVSDSLYVGVMHFAKAIVFPTRIYQGYTPPLQATSVRLQSNVTEGNNYIGTSAVRGGIGANASLTLIKDTFIRAADFQAFQTRFNSGLPFFWAWRPHKYQDLLYAWRSGSEIVPSNTGPKAYMGFDMSMRAYDDKS